MEYWLQKPHPVMLVTGTFSEDDERAIGKDKLEFAEVRWMEISSVLQHESQRSQASEANGVQRRTARPEQRAAVAGKDTQEVA